LFGGNGRSTLIESRNCDYLYRTGFEANINQSLPSGEFEFYNVFNSNCDNEKEIEAFKSLLFTPKSYSYDIGSEDLVIKFGFSPNTNQDKYFITSNGDQTGSSFTITSSKFNKPLTFFNQFEVSRTIEGSFNCKLYNEQDNTEKLELTEGKFRLVVFSESQVPLNEVINF